MKQLQEERYRDLIENLNDAVYTLDLKTMSFSSVNPAAQRLTGYTERELLAMPITQIIPPDYLPLVKRMINKKRKKAKATIYEIEIVRKNGTRVPVEISSRAGYEGDVPVEILGIARDITERKMIEEQRNIFISLITHEIKNPLTSIMMYQGLLQKRVKKDPTALSYIQTITTQTQQINALLSDILDVSQMRVGMFQITREETTIDEIISEAVKAFSSLKHTIKLGGKNKSKIWVDKTRVRQVITNLLSNAIKYSPEGSMIIIGTTIQKDVLTVSIQDFGKGISQNAQKRLFDLYYRTRDTAQSEVGGHGLGLFICREIIKHHKGKIWVESTPEKGSTFFFTLPLKVKK